MKIHEYQGKEILKKYGVPVPRGKVVSTPDEAYSAVVGAVREPPLRCPVVVKSQIHAGGRGKGKIYRVSPSPGLRPPSPLEGEGRGEGELVLDGGVKVVKSPEEARDVAAKILGNILVTHQTGPEGKIVKKVLIEEGCAIACELYLGVVLDRANSRVTIMASREGGMEIEEVAAKHPEKILKLAVDPLTGVDEQKAKEIAKQLGLASDTLPLAPSPQGRGDLADQFADFCVALYDAYVKADCTIAEINPLAVVNVRAVREPPVLALDAKINFDDNALFRHPDYEALRDLDEEDKAEIEAKKHDLSYVSMDGSIGCMVNGGGLAMATMDIIKLHGGEPANFLDVGGGATAEKVSSAFKIILADPKVKAILVNIFGGIMRCDTIAYGIVSALRAVGAYCNTPVPVVVRLQGTNVDIGKKILQVSGLNLISEDDLAKAAEKVVSKALNSKL